MYDQIAIAWFSSCSWILGPLAGLKPEPGLLAEQYTPGQGRVDR